MILPRSIRVLQMDSFPSFHGWVILHCSYVPQVLYPLFLSGTISLLASLCSWKEGCTKYWGACVLWLLALPGYMLHSGISGSSVALDFRGLRNSKLFSRVAVHNLPSHHHLGRVSFFSSPPPAFLAVRLGDDGHSVWWDMIPLCRVDLHYRNIRLPKRAFGVCRNTHRKNPNAPFVQPSHWCY